MSDKFRDLIVTDRNTGEVLDRLPVYCPQKAHSLFSNEGFVNVAQLAAAKSLAKLKLEGIPHRVLWQIISELGMNNYVILNQSESAREMGIDRSSFNRALKQLIAENIILEEFKKEQSKTKIYRLNPNYGWKGNTKDHIEALENYEDIQNINTEISKVVEDNDLTVTVTVKRKKFPGNSRN